MDRYKIITKLGEGTFGCVWKAVHKKTGETVAIKAIKRQYCSWEKCLQLQEVKSLRKMKHPNIIKLEEAIREENNLYLVFEYMDGNLHQLIRGRGKMFSEAEVRTMCFQVFQGLAYMHQQGYFHRDLKPENLLVSENAIKIGDLGSAREINSQPPYTHYVTTRWYRAPEVMLQSEVYGAAVDMWAMGAIMAELFTLRTLFPGTSTSDQMYRICSVIGTPTESKWHEGLKLATSLNYHFPQCPGVTLSAFIPSASRDAIDLITRLCSWDPCKRPTALEALQHPFFQSCVAIPPPIGFRASVNKTSISEKNSLPRRLPPNSKPPGFDHPAFPPKPPDVNYNLSKAALNPESRYCPPAMNIPSSLYHCEMLPNMSYNLSNAVTKQESRYCPAAMNAPSGFYHTEITRQVSETSEMLEIPFREYNIFGLPNFIESLS